MNGNSFGTIFRITTWGESHGPALGVVIDGCPSGLPLSVEDFRADLARRQGGGASFATPRKEADEIEIESGVFEGVTTGTPIALRIRNLSQQSGDYDSLKEVFRPGHADLTTHLKHGHRDHRGGGRSSARETTARVAAGVVAKKILSSMKVEMAAWVSRVGPMALESAELSLEDIRKNRDASALGLAMPDTRGLTEAVNQLRSAGDSWGGAVECRVEGLPAGIGEPIFDKLGALLGHALLSLPAATAFEAGGGAHMSELPGSAIRDPITQSAEGPRPAENKHGGLLGGMSTGLPLRVSVAFHAPTSIPRPISTVSKNGQSQEITVGGRHDAFPLPRAVPMVEAMVAIVLVDTLLRAGRIPERL